MAIKFVSKLPPSDRRALPFDEATPPTILPGQVVQENASALAVLADGASVVESPKWAFTDSARKDSSKASSVTVVEGPFTADVDTAGYDGNPAKGDALAVGTGGLVGKLVIIAPASVADLASVVAYCERPADADGFIRIRAIR
jgi:hypothetical protein